MKGILKSSHEPTDKLFVCQAHSSQPGILKPINKNVPPIYALTISPRMRVAKKGNMCVYRFTTSNCIEFSHYETMQQSSNADSSSPSARLFTVRYLTWPAGLSFPIGLVVGVLNPGTCLDSGLQILRLEQNLLSSFSAQASEQARQIFNKPSEDDDITQLRMRNRQDLTSHFCFTVEDSDIEDIEIAISINEADGNYDV